MKISVTNNNGISTCWTLPNGDVSDAESQELYTFITRFIGLGVVPIVERMGKPFVQTVTNATTGPEAHEED